MKKISFLHSEFLTLTVMGTFQRNRIYADGVTEKDRKTLQESLKRKLVELSANYANPVSDSVHEANIEKLANQLSTEHAPVLNGRFRIGSAQKALNLYLKYLWCIGEIPTPPHCPFDLQIIQLLPFEFHGIKWTKLDDMGVYRKLVAAAKTCAAPATLAEWELAAWSN